MEATQVNVQEGQKKKGPVFQVPKKRKKWIRVLAILLVAALAVWWFLIRPLGAAGQALTAGLYQPDTARLRDLTVSVDGSGTVTPIESYDVRALVTGEILEAPFEVGDWIEKGDLLYRLDAGDAETALQQAQLSVRQAQLSYDELSSGMYPSPSAAGGGAAGPCAEGRSGGGGHRHRGHRGHLHHDPYPALPVGRRGPAVPRTERPGDHFRHRRDAARHSGADLLRRPGGGWRRSCAAGSAPGVQPPVPSPRIRWPPLWWGTSPVPAAEPLRRTCARRWWPRPPAK